MDYYKQNSYYIILSPKKEIVKDQDLQGFFLVRQIEKKLLCFSAVSFILRKRDKMAYVKKRKLATKTSWQVIIRKKGFKTLVKSFSSRSDAYKWSRHMERDLRDFFLEF